MSIKLKRGKQISIIVLIMFLFGISLRLIVYKKVVVVNTSNLMSNNVKEYGKRNLIIFDLLYYIFFGGCLIEAYIRKTQFDNYMIIGQALFLFSYLMFIFVL